MTQKQPQEAHLYILFIISLLLAGFGWLFVRVQLTYMPADLAVCYRFFLSGVGLLLFSYLKGEKFQGFPFRKLPWLMGFALTYYYLNVACSYQAVAYLPSGIVALGISMIMVPSSILESLWHRTPIDKVILFAGLLSFIGLFFALDNDNNFLTLDLSPQELIGWGFIVLCLIFASFGSLFAVHLKHMPFTIIQGTAYGLLTGATLNAFFYFLSGRSFLWTWEPDFLISLFYMSAFVSGFVFVCFNYFLKAWGIGRSNYFFVLLPLVAMNASALFEGMVWTLPRIFGTCLVLLSGFIVLKSKFRSRNISNDAKSSS